MADAAVALSVRGLSLKPGAVLFEQTIRRGEIVGLAGLDGHGQDAFIETLAGLRPPVAGEVLAGGREIRSFRQAVRSGIAYLPRDRRATGIFPSMSILDNFAIATVGRDRRLGLISAAERRKRYDYYRDRLSIVAPEPGHLITTLSGGNQQKVLLARALAHKPDVLLLNDPTRGVDIATRRVLYAVFRELAAEGMALVILSTEIEEALVLCDRILVFREQELAASLEGVGRSSERIISTMFGRAA
ncbi:ATP-binding cassette domain-containing protein [Kaistia nematophila]|uniref:ATP-binding cassette domain-containing protein n=1 Tax=Kaistia nematophila TaxID=2994654 RepID=A0A9X3E4K9_9HYPH|nr:ATP-binding cassette domain-containing protein [Kaistia nematophila]MCX5571704.1 ATP-binding cassette domain-containing protein [Kaistia nematophila]